jgi:hypothetical protein
MARSSPALYSAGVPWQVAGLNDQVGADRLTLTGGEPPTEAAFSSSRSVWRALCQSLNELAIIPTHGHIGDYSAEVLAQLDTETVSFTGLIPGPQRGRCAGRLVG